MDARSLLAMAANAVEGSVDPDMGGWKGMSPEILARAAQQHTNEMNHVIAKSDNLGPRDYGDLPFGKAFRQAMTDLGEGKTFMWRGKEKLLKYAANETAAPDFSGGVSGAIQQTGVDLSGVTGRGFPVIQRNSDTYNIGIGGIQMPEETVTAQRPQGTGFEASFDAGINSLLSGIRSAELPNALEFLRPAKPYMQ